MSRSKCTSCRTNYATEHLVYESQGYTIVEFYQCVLCWTKTQRMLIFLADPREPRAVGGVRAVARRVEHKPALGGNGCDPTCEAGPPHAAPWAGGAVNREDVVALLEDCGNCDECRACERTRELLHSLRTGLLP